MLKIDKETTPTAPRQKRGRSGKKNIRRTSNKHLCLYIDSFGAPKAPPSASCKL